VLADAEAARRVAVLVQIKSDDCAENRDIPEEARPPQVPTAGSVIEAE
jgi:hypothetical protein